VLAKNGRTYRRAIQHRFGTLEEASRGLGFRVTSWSGVSMPLAAFTERRFLFPETPDLQVYCDVKAKLPPADWITCDLDAIFAQSYCRSQWSDIAHYNDAHGTKLASYRDNPALDDATAGIAETVARGLGEVRPPGTECCVHPHRRFGAADAAAVLVEAVLRQDRRVESAVGDALRLIRRGGLPARIIDVERPQSTSPRS
jgi:hypothetical protein